MMFMQKFPMLSLAAVILALFSGCVSQPIDIPPTPPQTVPTNFAECVAAGYPVMESYPAQCAVPGGPSFTQVLTDSECQNADVDFCPAGCVVCPPCPECSSIECRSEEFCASLGFDRSWYESMDIK